MPREVIYQRHRAGKLGIQDMDPDLLTPNLASLGYRVYGLLSQQEPDQFLHPPPSPLHSHTFSPLSQTGSPQQPLSVDHSPGSFGFLLPHSVLSSWD